ncbi:MAG: PilN domain-containing protein [Candidatus Moranbacteria bacterium]|jgi:Tfp pilus assembly protein PilN|nr:PilN domain-containing protein [Candidatus Moranbacteria bacterium]
MTGVNLSQSMPDEEQSEKRSFFDTGIILSLAVLLVVAAGWGGIQLYIASLDKKIAAQDAAIGTSADRLRGDTVDRIADFDERLNYFIGHRPELSDPQDVFSRLERVMVSGVTLTKFDYSREDGVIIVEGVTSDFRKLAEQVLGLKGDTLFSQVKVDQIDRNEAGQVTFIFKANF